MGKRKTSVRRDYSMPLAGVPIPKKREPEPEPVIEVVVKKLKAQKAMMVATLKTQDWSVWKQRLFPGPLIFYIMFIVAMLVAWAVI